MTYNEFVQKSAEKINKINELIAEEKESATVNKYEILKLEQAKMLSMLFGGSTDISNARYRLPW